MKKNRTPIARPFNHSLSNNTSRIMMIAVAIFAVGCGQQPDEPDILIIGQAPEVENRLEEGENRLEDGTKTRPSQTDQLAQTKGTNQRTASAQSIKPSGLGQQTVELQSNGQANGREVTGQTLAQQSSRVDGEPAIQNFLAGAWDEVQTAAILDKTMRLKFAFDDRDLSGNEKLAVQELLLAGDRLHTLYMEQRHPQARAVETALADMSEDETGGGIGRRDLQELFRIEKGPIATTLDNKRTSFLRVDPETPTRNIYPAGLTQDVMDAYFEANPEQRDKILHLRSVVKTANESEKQAALNTLDAHPTLEVLHPDIRSYIENASQYFALPYSIAYADDIFYIYDRLQKAASHVEGEDIAFAKFLRLRARDLLADDYDGGDAAWVTSQFTGNLNAQIGSYETYDDALYGVKSFFSLSLLKRDIEQSNTLAAAIGDIQAIEDALPYDAHKQVRSNIPVGVYDVVADYGQARGTNTATILPNEGHLSRQYGRTILIRSNVLTNPEIFAEAHKGFKAATADVHHDDFAIEGNFYRTLWHEIGHYMGPDQTKDGGDIDAALQDSADLVEEMKSDLVSLFSARAIHKSGGYTDQQLRAIYAAGIMRVLQKNKPRREQAYQTMQLIQWNWFMDKGLLAFKNGILHIDYDLYPEAADSLLKEVLDLQYQGNRDETNKFVEKWTKWDEQLHGVIASKMKASEGSRYRLVTYEALGE